MRCTWNHAGLSNNGAFDSHTPLPSPQYSQSTVSLGLGCLSTSLLCSPGADQLAARLRDVRAAAQRSYSQSSARISPAERPAASQLSQVQAIPPYIAWPWAMLLERRLNCSFLVWPTADNLTSGLTPLSCSGMPFQITTLDALLELE